MNVNRAILVFSVLSLALVALGPLIPNSSAFNGNFTSDSTPIEIRLPIARIIPDPKNPFAPGTWDDAITVPFSEYHETNTKATIESSQTYFSGKYTPNGSNPRLFLYVDAPFAENRAKELSFVFQFDTRDDGNIDFLANPWDLQFARTIDPNDKPPTFQYHFFDGDNLYAREIEKKLNGVNGTTFFSWNFGPSETSSKNHLEGYAEIPIPPLQRYPNPKDRSRMGFIAQVWQTDITNTPPGHQVPPGTVWQWAVLGSRVTENGVEKWPQLVFTNSFLGPLTTLSTTSTLLPHTEITGPTITTERITTPVNLENKSTQINTTGVILLGLLLTATIAASAMYVIQGRKVIHGDRA